MTGRSSNPYRDRLLGVGVISGRSRDRVESGRRDDGSRYKAVTDQLGHTVTERSTSAKSGVSEHQDVLLRPGTVRWKLGEPQ